MAEGHARAFLLAAATDLVFWVPYARLPRWPAKSPRAFAAVVFVVFLLRRGAAAKLIR
jgi:hypothetical protein